VSDSISDSEPLQDVKADEAYMREQVEKLLDSLNPREADVVKMRYGLIDGQQRTLEEIGVAFRVTRERVRQIEARALHKIKQPYRCHKLRDHVNVNREVISVFGYRSEVGAEEPEPFVAPPTPARGRGARRASGSASAGAGVEAGVLVSAGGAAAGRRRRSTSSRGKASATVEYAFSGRSNNATLAG
jgi:hypothetical protein